MIIDGNSKVGSAKVYETAKEMELEKEIERLKKKNEKLRNCVQFYADKNNYWIRDIMTDEGDNGEIIDALQDDVDESFYGGKLARQTLRELGKEI